MDRTYPILRSFAGGEMSPDLRGRADLEKYRTGLAQCLNFVPTPQGAVYARTGSKFIANIKTPGDAVPPALLTFRFNNDQTYLLEFGNLYLRFFRNGVVIHGAGGGPYEIATPYTLEQAHELGFTQSADVITVVHSSHPPMLLSRVADSSWTLVAEVFNARLSPPVIEGSANSSGGAGTPLSHKFVATTFDPNTTEESVASASITSSCDLTVLGNFISFKSTQLNTNIYMQESGLYGYVGQTAADPALVAPFVSSMVIRNVAPDLSRTPPIYADIFDSANNYPAVVAYRGQRKVYAATNNEPQSHWMSESATESSFAMHQPGVATDAIKYTLAGREINAVRHIVEQTDMYLFTAGNIWRSQAANGIVSASTLSYESKAGIGAGFAPPVATPNTVLFVSERSQTVHELNTREQLTADYAVRNVGLLADHLFANHAIVQLGYVHSPKPVALALRDDGVVLGLSYLPEEQVLGWFQLNFGAPVFGLAVVPEGRRDSLYITVQRNGQWCIEQFQFEEAVLGGDRWHLDSQIKYEGAATTTFNIPHLAAQAVYLVDSGANQHGPYAVNGSGDITHTGVPLTSAYIGLRYIPRIETLPLLVAELPDGGLAAELNVTEVYLRVKDTIGLRVRGTGNPLLSEHQDFGDGEEHVDRIDRANGVIKINVSDYWGPDGVLFIEQAAAQPARILSLTAMVALGFTG